MQIHSEFLVLMHKLMVRHKILSLSGESGTGKTTFALQMVGNFLTHTYPFEECCIWVQASEIFPIRRFSRVFDNSLDKYNYLQKNILITPFNTTLNNYKNQSEFLTNFINELTILPPNLRYIVVDNISHHLRFEISKYKDIKLITSLIDDFYEFQLMPLIMFCQREGICLLLIHEVSYDPNSGQNRTFLYKLYDRVNTIKIELSNRCNNQNKSMKILFKDYSWMFDYALQHNGLVTL